MGSELATKLQAEMQRHFEGEMEDRKVTKMPVAVGSASTVLVGLYKLANHVAALEARLAAVEGHGIKYAGVWQRAQDYKRGDVVTHDGSAWVALAVETRAQPGATDGWQLLVKGAR
jgi:hypothetical protein